MHRTVSFLYSLLLSLILIVSIVILLSVSESNSSFPKIASIDKGNGKVIVLGNSLPFSLSNLKSAGTAASKIVSFNKTLFPKPLYETTIFVTAEIGDCAKEILFSCTGLFEKIITQNV
jgi:hypothetical protein